MATVSLSDNAEPFLLRLPLVFIFSSTVFLSLAVDTSSVSSVIWEAAARTSGSLLRFAQAVVYTFLVVIPLGSFNTLRPPVVGFLAAFLGVAFFGAAFLAGFLVVCFLASFTVGGRTVSPPIVINSGSASCP